MLVGGDFNLNSMRRYNDSLLEIQKQTILEHEAIFRRQVHELHRLYKIQKKLMEDLSWKEFKGRTSWTTSAQSIPMPLQDRPKYKQLNIEEFLPSLSMVDLTQTSNQGACPKLKPRPLDLQLPTDDYISHFGVELPKQSKQGDSWASPKEAMKVGKFSVGNQIADPEEVKLSLSAGKDTRNLGCQGGCTTLSVPDVIDLEESVGRTSLGVAKPFLSIDSEAPSTYIGDKNGLQDKNRRQCDLSFSGKAREEPCHWIFMKCSLENNERQEQKSLGPGINDLDGSSPSMNQCNRKPSSSWKMEFVDLNRVQLEESSCFSNAPLVTVPSPAASSSGVPHRLTDNSIKETCTVPTCWRKPNSSYSDETYELLQQDNAAHSTLSDAREKDNSAQASSRSTKLTASSGNKMGLIDLESLPEDLLESSEDLVGQSAEPREDNIDLSLGRRSGLFHHDKIDDSTFSTSSKLVDSHVYTSVGCTRSSQTATDKEIGQESCEKSEEDTVSSSPCQSHVIQAECYLDSPAAPKPDWIGLSKREERQFEQNYKYKLAGSDCPVPEESRANHVHSQVTEMHSSQHDPIVEVACVIENSCDCSKLNCQDCDELQQEAQETDHLVSRAAESLLQISLESSNCPQDCIPNSGSGGLMNEQNEEPQHSSDSFESIVLRLEDSNADDYCVTSALVEAKEPETEMKGSVVSLRRGRRLKDFQKDVLPGLISLSRHEICEDIHSIGGIIKTKEFRKSRSKVSAQNWFEPMRSRRSRFNYVC